MYKKLSLVLIGLVVVLALGTGLGSGSSPGMFIKLIIGLMILAVVYTVSISILKNSKIKNK